MIPDMLAAGARAFRAPARAAADTPWFHATSTTAVEGVMRDGLLVRPNAQGAYGDGVYFASKADRRYGGAVVQARIGAQHPFLVRERQFLDMAHFERQVAPLVERFQTAQPSAAAGLEQGALIRAALRDAGHDAIIVSRRPWEAKWLIALDDVPAANLTRVQ